MSSVKTRIATFKNGHGDLIYRIEYRYWFLPIWFTHGGGDQITEYESKVEAEIDLERMKLREKDRARIRVKTT